MMAGSVLQIPLLFKFSFGFCFSYFLLLFFAYDLIFLSQRVFESTFAGRKSIIKERFSKKYRHPLLDSKLTLKRLNAVGLYPTFFF